MEIIVQKFKPFGKWYSDDVVKVPKNVSSFEIWEYLNKLFYKEDEYKWILVVHPDLQPSIEASEFVGFPRMVKL